MHRVASFPMEVPDFIYRITRRTAIRSTVAAGLHTVDFSQDRAWVLTAGPDVDADSTFVRYFRDWSTNDEAGYLSVVHSQDNIHVIGLRDTVRRPTSRLLFSQTKEPCEPTLFRGNPVELQNKHVLIHYNQLTLVHQFLPLLSRIGQNGPLMPAFDLPDGMSPPLGSLVTGLQVGGCRRLPVFGLITSAETMGNKCRHGVSMLGPVVSEFERRQHVRVQFVPSVLPGMSPTVVYILGQRSQYLKTFLGPAAAVFKTGSQTSDTSSTEKDSAYMTKKSPEH